ncbi:glycoside hydrolase family 5 protein [Kitasatospora sp. NPDC052896]|uniref:glycoside hydrolase family 5 protein n=1 Tax=Kitasatospora sp. NPDC052896 TaxID=3364061 RepID=UPI0037C95918
MRVRRTAAAVSLALAAALCVSAAPTPAPAVPATRSALAQPDFPTGSTTTPDGRTLFTDSAGRTELLRGFDLDKYDETTRADLRAIADHGFTLIRVAISWDRLEPAQGRYDQAEFGKLRQLLDWADQDGLLALVDFHQDVYGPEFGGGQDGIPPWATRDDGLPFTPVPGDWFAGYFEPSVQAAFRHLYDDPDLRRWQQDFYAHVAGELRGQASLLGYDLFNEPSGPFDGDPTDPAVQVASAAALEQGRLAAMYRRLIGAVRAVDDRAWLFVEPTVLVGEGVPTQLPGFTDPRPGAARIGYAPHFYDTAVEGGADWNPADGFIQAYTAAITGYPRAHRLPVLVGEWGPPQAATPGNAELVRRQVAALAGFATGWALWYWCRGTGGYCALGPDGRPAPGDGPVFAPYAPVVAGLPRRESWDGARYTLEFSTGPGGWTELAVPPGARIAVRGAGPAVVTAGRPGRARVLLPFARPGTTAVLTVTG